jgi:hypothetical protein
VRKEDITANILILKLFIVSVTQVYNIKATMDIHAITQARPWNICVAVIQAVR